MSSGRGPRSEYANGPGLSLSTFAAAGPDRPARGLAGRPPGPATGPANAADSPATSRITRPQTRAGTLQSAIRLDPVGSFGAIGSPPTGAQGSFRAIGSPSVAGSGSFRGVSSP